MKSFVSSILASLYGRMRTAYYEKRYNFYRKNYKIKTAFQFNGTDIRIYGAGQIVAGNDSYIGTNSTIQLHPGQKVIIGCNCSISHNVRMYTSSALPDQVFDNTNDVKIRTGDIIIGDGVWIGANVFINPNVVIGDNAVIGANSVISKDVPPNAIVGGVPAKLIRYKKTHEGEQREVKNNPSY